MLPTDIKVTGASLWFLPVQTRVPLKFGTETLTHVTCARARVRVQAQNGKQASGWGETPLNVQWVWPSTLTYSERLAALEEFCRKLAGEWTACGLTGHPLECGQDLIAGPLRTAWREWNLSRPAGAAMPWLAALVCASVFDQAVHDAFGQVHGVPVYETYHAAWMSRDLSHFMEPAHDRAGTLTFSGKYPDSFLLPKRRNELMAWHLVGGLDPVDSSELTGTAPNDGYPVLLEDWIRRDGLLALKIKLRGNDSGWDYDRLIKVGRCALKHGVLWLTADFNCTVTEPAYVTGILDRLRDDEPRIFALLLYVEQPFPYELDEHPIPVHAVSSRRPLFLDESAHDWQHVRTGRSLGWTGVALKTCKTQTGALLSLCWASAHGMTLMVQDLTNPMLAAIPHCLLAAHSPTIAGVETNAPQFYPEASAPEAAIHPGIYRRQNGRINLQSIHGPGFGYQADKIQRQLPAPEFEI